MNEKKEKIYKIMEDLETIMNNNDYNTFITALIIWLRSGSLENFTDQDIKELDKIINEWNESLLNEDLKNIIDRYEII